MIFIIDRDRVALVNQGDEALGSICLTVLEAYISRISVFTQITLNCAIYAIHAVHASLRKIRKLR